MTSYQSTIAVANESESLVDHGTEQRNRRTGFPLIAAIVTLALIAVAAFVGKSNSVSDADFPLMGKPSPSKSSPACSFAVCERSGCPVNIAPFACTGWTDPNLKTIGCSPMPWIVGAMGSTCIESCDLSNCKDAVPDDDEIKSCEGVLCEHCDDVKCGSGAPFQCLEGSSRYACSADEYYYNLLPVTQCTGCCDTRECSKH